MSNKMIKKAAACTLSAVMAFGLVAVTDAPKTTNVSAATKKVKKLSFKKKGYVMKSAGRWMNVRIRLNFSPKSSKTKNLTYKTSNKKIATVSKTGILRTKKKGTVTITATAKDAGKKKATFKVTVKKKAVTPAKPTTETLIPVATGNGKVKLSGIDPKASQYVLKYKDNSVTISAKEAKEALGYLDDPESGYQAWVNTSYREKGFVSVSGKGNTKTVTLTANTKYAGKYEVTVTKVTAGKVYKVHAERKATGGTRDITVTVNNGVVTAKNDKTGVEYTAQKENGKYSIELPESIGNNVTIIQTVAK